MKGDVVVHQLEMYQLLIRSEYLKNIVHKPPGLDVVVPTHSRVGRYFNLNLLSGCLVRMSYSSSKIFCFIFSSLVLSARKFYNLNYFI